MKDLKLKINNKEFIPKLGQYYYYPNFTLKPHCGSRTWSNSVLDKRIRKAVGVYETIHKAINMANELWDI